MCSRYDLTCSPDELMDWFKVPWVDDFPPRRLIRPAEPVAIIRHDFKNEREFALTKWGLLPSWVKDPQDFPLLFNARGETAAEKPSFRAPMNHKRALFPVTAFYEWIGPKGDKTPIKFTLQTQENEQKDPLFALAGLWEHYIAADGSEIQTSAIITVDANETVKPIHSRMPAIIAKEDFDDWLNCKNTPAKEAANLLKPAADDLLQQIDKVT